MELSSEFEVANTRRKLARLEARYEALREGANENARLRELSMISLKRMINQFTEEIARYNAQRHAEPQTFGSTQKRRNSRELKSEVEVTNTRKKLRLLEEICEEVRQRLGGDEALRDMELKSLTRLVNQLKEEIARYEARHSVQN
jgi:hypothetical protein